MFSLFYVNFRFFANQNRGLNFYDDNYDVMDEDKLEKCDTCRLKYLQRVGLEKISHYIRILSNYDELGKEINVTPSMLKILRIFVKFRSNPKRRSCVVYFWKEKNVRLTKLTKIYCGHDVERVEKIERPGRRFWSSQFGIISTEEKFIFSRNLERKTDLVVANRRKMIVEARCIFIPRNYDVRTVSR